MSSRRTQQRHAIRKAFEDAGRPLGPQEVLELAQSTVSGLGIATVYRALKKFQQDGILKEVELPGVPSRYELTGLNHHHHFCCRSCDKVFDVDGCADRVAELAPEGFKLESHEIVLYGQCPSCSTEASPAAEA